MKVKLVSKLMLGIFLSANSGCAGTVVSPRATAKFNVVVTDFETGMPMKGVRVLGSFQIGGYWDSAYNTLEETHAYTDKNGRCALSGVMNFPTGARTGVAKLPGYYNTSAMPQFDGKAFRMLNRWLPDDQTIYFALDKIKNPIPLFIRREHLRKNLNKFKDADSWWPEETAISYDFLKADWLPPHGNGEVADMTIMRHKRQVLGIGCNPGGVSGEAFIDRMTVRFNGNENGIVDIVPHEHPGIKIRTAPDKDYIQEKEIWMKKDMSLVFSQKDTDESCQCFRIRTKRNEKGEIVGSYYGKMYGGFRLLNSREYKTAGIEFTYYLNPTNNDKNLEWDQKTNLCKRAGKDLNLILLKP